jgi:hypothetical protein
MKKTIFIFLVMLAALSAFAQSPLPKPAAAPAPTPMQDSLAKPAAVPAPAPMQDSLAKPAAVSPPKPLLDSMPKTLNVSVLPLVGGSISDRLLEVLCDDFRQALQATGKFKVMARAEMEEIMKEQAFQMSGACDEASCMVEAGRIIGVSRIVSGAITLDPNNYYIASAKIINVETGQILVTVTERRKGDSYETNRRMLQNLATVLAGTPNQDHLDYVAAQEKLTGEARVMEKHGLNRFSLSVSGTAAFPFSLLQADNNKPKKDYYEKSPEIVEYKVASEGPEFGGGGRFGVRLGESVWFLTGLNFSGISATESYVISRSNIDTTLSGAQTLRLTGPMDIASRTQYAWSMLTAQAGIEWTFFRSTRIDMGLAFLPCLGYLWDDMSSFDSSFANEQMFINNAYMGQNLLYSEESRSTSLSGFVFGGQAGLSVSAHIATGISLTVSGSLELRLSPSVSGTTDGRLVETVKNPVTSPAGQTTDSTYSESAAMMKGNFLGTGDYLQVQNPDVKNYDPQGRYVSMQKSYKEFSGFQIRAALGYSF